MTTGLAIGIIILAILALWQMRELARLRAERDHMAAHRDRALDVIREESSGTAAPERPRRAWDFRVGPTRSHGKDLADLAAADVTALSRKVAELSGWINYRSQAFRAVHAGEEIPNLEQFVNMLIVGHIEAFRLGIEQQLPMLAALRYASDEKLTDVVVGLRAAAEVAAKRRALESAGSGQSQLVGGALQERARDQSQLISGAEDSGANPS